MGFFTNLLNSELGAKTASKADDTSSPGDTTTIDKDMKGKKNAPFGGKQAPPFGSKKEGSDQGDTEQVLRKIAADTMETKKFIDKVASVLREDAGADDEALYRNCASAVVHLKLAGRIKPEFDTPRSLAEMAYHLYEDILSNG